MSTAVANFLQAAQDRQRPSMDRYGRYEIASPATGEVKGRTRATGIAQTLSDKFGLGAWQTRMTAIGLAHNPELLAGVAANASIDQDNKVLDEICAEAAVRAGSRLKADLGTHLHHFTELVDRGADPRIPEPYDRDVAAYRKMIDHTGLRIVPGMIERVVLLDELNIAGTFDRIVELAGLPLPLIADIKTGDIEYKGNEISIQLAVYAHGEVLWRPDGFDPMPEVDQHTGLIIHMPVEQAECTLHLVDLDPGWEMVQTCLDVREWRKRKGLITAWNGPPSVDAGTTPSSGSAQAGLGGLDQEWGVQRLTRLFDHVQSIGRIDDLRQIVESAWPAELPTSPPWTAEQLDLLSDQLDALEGHFEVPFGRSQPSVMADQAGPAPEPEQHVMLDVAPQRTVVDRSPRTARRDVDGLMAMFGRLSDEQSRLLRRWSTEALRSGHGFDVADDGTMTERVWSIARAAYVCACRLEPQADLYTCAALSLVLDQAWVPSWETGAVLGVLTQDEAVQLAFVADSWASNNPEAVSALSRIASTIEPF